MFDIALAYEIHNKNQALTTGATTSLASAPSPTSKRIVVLDIILSSDVVNLFTIKSGTTTILGPINVPAGESIQLGDLWLLCSPGEALQVTHTGTITNGGIYVEYIIR